MLSVVDPNVVRRRIPELGVSAQCFSENAGYNTWTIHHEGCRLKMQVFEDVMPCHRVFPDVSKNRSPFFFRVKHCKKTLMGLLRPEDEGTLYNPKKCREILTSHIFSNTDVRTSNLARLP
jgi:hypothetical protein